MPEPNQNRQLDADAAIELFGARLPHLVEGLTVDRAWLWWAGPKPSDRDRSTLCEIGFQFTPKPHTCDGGLDAHWYHACGGRVVRRGGGKNRVVSSSKQSSKHARPTPERDETREALARFAELLS